MGARRFSTILAADVTGYQPKAAANDTDGAPFRKGHPASIFPMIAGFEGRIVERTGTGIIVEFLDVVDAAKCAASLQDAMLERNVATPSDRRTHLRIGIDQGDVQVEGNSVSGEGVEIATRLEAICDPGGICISAKVYDEIKSRFQAPYQDIGEQSLKDISAPVRAYKIDLGGATAAKAAKAVRSAKAGKAKAAPVDAIRASRAPRKGTMAASAAAILFLSAGAVGTWWALAPGSSGQTVVAGAKPAAKPVVVAAAPSPARAEREFEVAALPSSGPVAAMPPSSVARAEAMPPPEGGSRVEIHTAAPAAAKPAAAAGTPAPSALPPAQVASLAKGPAASAPARAETAPAAAPPAAKAAEPAPAPVAPAKPVPAQAAPTQAAPAAAPAVVGAPAAKRVEIESPPPKAAVPDAPAVIAALPPAAEEPPSQKTREHIADLTKKGVLAAQSNDFPFAKLWFDEILLMQPKNIQALNNRCWVNAMLNELSAATKDCDDALRLQPNFLDALDSRGLVKLKGGKPREAITDYDAALKIQANKASSLFGRGMAKKRSGNAAGGDADIARARTINPRIADEFASYGIR